MRLTRKEGRLLRDGLLAMPGLAAAPSSCDESAAAPAGQPAPLNMKQTNAQPWKKRAIVLLQAALAIGVLVFIFQDRIRRAQMEDAVRHASVTWLILGVLCYGAVEVLGGLRWHLLLRVQDFRLSWRRATSIFLIGLFLMTFTPGLIGGDAARMLYVIREEPERKADAVLVVAMDRLMGLISLILLAVLVVACRSAWLAQTPATGWLESVTLVILAGGAGMLLLSGLAARLPWLSMARRHPAIEAKLREIGETFQAYRRHWPKMIHALLNTLAAHGFYFLTFYCAARALGAFDEPGHRQWRGLWDMFCVMPIVNTLTALPVSLAGIGIRESLFQVLLKDLCAIPPGVGAAIGSLGFAMRAVWSLPGGVLLMKYRAPEHRAREATAVRYRGKQPRASNVPIQ